MELKLQGRMLQKHDLEYIKWQLIAHPDWHRSRLSQEICRHWNWVKPDGQLKDMACRTMLLKLERLGYIRLPARIRNSHNASRYLAIEPVLHCREVISCSLKELMPLEVQHVQNGYDHQKWKYYLSEYHYLGYTGYVGENQKYLVRAKNGRDLGCLLFGSAAWSCKDRDHWIGWESDNRQRKMHLVAGNHRFLILPFVKVPHLASHILGLILKRLNQDYQEVYGHPIHLVETFVDPGFKGTCYKASNFIHVGHTTGRTRNDRFSAIKAARKAIYVYPLRNKARERLCE